MVHKIGIIGLGSRGSWWLEYLIKREDIELTAVCDEYADRVEEAVRLAQSKGISSIRYAGTDYRDILNRKEIEIAFILTAWESHIPLAVDFMNAGIVTAMEVGGAYTLEDCYRLVREQEKTGTAFFLMENCCYGKREMMIRNMVNHNAFGEIVHCQGCYGHDLREEITQGLKNRHYRYRNYLRRNCDNYPTHELGPIARILNINHGNRMLSLTSTASRAAGLAAYLREKGEEKQLPTFAQGDIVNTVIKCAGGETILLTLDTCLPRPYSRGLQVRGTKGMYMEETDMVYLDDCHYPQYELDARPLWGNAKEFEEEYLAQPWKGEVDVSEGHGGMDGLMISDFLRCLEQGLPMPIDVYDAAAWMSISCLSEESVRKGGAPVAIPDFTGGRWLLESEK